jgi:hypothetical protein
VFKESDNKDGIVACSGTGDTLDNGKFFRPCPFINAGLKQDLL